MALVCESVIYVAAGSPKVLVVFSPSLCASLLPKISPSKTSLAAALSSPTGAHFSAQDAARCPFAPNSSSTSVDGLSQLLACLPGFLAIRPPANSTQSATKIKLAGQHFLQRSFLSFSPFGTPCSARISVTSKPNRPPMKTPNQPSK